MSPDLRTLLRPSPQNMGRLIEMVETGQITHATGRIVLRQMVRARWEQVRDALRDDRR